VPGLVLVLVQVPEPVLVPGLVPGRVLVLALVPAQGRKPQSAPLSQS
jgi:hypothetical protein